MPNILRMALIDQAGLQFGSTEIMEIDPGNNKRVITPCVEPIPIHDKATRWKGGGDTRNNDGAGNGLGIGKPGDVMPTMTRGDRHAVLCAAFKQGNSAMAGGIGYAEELSPTLTSGQSGTNLTPAVLCREYYPFACNCRDEVRLLGSKSACLQAQPGMKQTTFLAIKECPFMIGNVSATLRAGAGAPKHASDENGRLVIHSPQTILFEPRSQDGVPRIHGEICPTLNTAQGGQRQPCVAYGVEEIARSEEGEARDRKYSVTYAVQGSMIGREDKNGPQGSGVNEDVCFTLNTTDRHAVCFTSQEMVNDDGSDAFLTDSSEDYLFANCAAIDCRNLCENERVSGTLQSKATGGYSLNYQNPVRVAVKICPVQKQLKVQMKYRVRRLTPLECERLQGLPDGWTKVLVKKVSRKVADKMVAKGEEVEVIDGEFWVYGSDSARYKALGNGMAQPNVDFVIGRIWYVINKYRLAV